MNTALSVAKRAATDLSGIASVVEETRQVFDVPQPALICTQHDSHWVTCPGCGKVCRGKFPAQVKSEIQYGDNIAAAVASIWLTTSSYLISAP